MRDALQSRQEVEPQRATFDHLNHARKTGIRLQSADRMDPDSVVGEKEVTDANHRNNA
jgi:hypothetical protein